MSVFVIKAILSGVGGSLILALFCSTFLAIETILAIMPLFIGFNGAVIGYKLVDGLKREIRDVSVFSFVMGTCGGALTFIALNAMSTWVPNGFRLSFFDLMVFMIVSGVTSVLGARLAVRYFNL